MLPGLTPASSPKLPSDHPSMTAQRVSQKPRPGDDCEFWEGLATQGPFEIVAALMPLKNTEKQWAAPMSEGYLGN
ncbi:hypothetical protein PG984_012184 [Apiospora sp. TS-2023a]